MPERRALKRHSGGGRRGRRHARKKGRKNHDYFKRRNVKLVSAIAGALFVFIFLLILFIQVIIPGITQEKVVAGAAGQNFTISEALERSAQAFEKALGK